MNIRSANVSKYATMEHQLLAGSANVRFDIKEHQLLAPQQVEVNQSDGTDFYNNKVNEQ